MKVFFITCLIIFCSGCTTSSKAQTILNGLDTFGSKRISAEDVSRKYKTKIEEWVLAAKKQQPEFGNLKKEIETSIKNQYDFAFVNLSLVTYFSPIPGDYTTVDVVEHADVQKRMDFLPEPNGKLEDPDGLIAIWNEYLELAFALQKSGQFEYPKSCPAWHCTHGFENPKLAPFLEKFNKFVPLNEQKLVRILKEDSRAQFRGNAAFLLAHIKNGTSVIKYMLASVTDSSSLVRNNTMRVLAEIATKHPEMDIPLGPILKVLNFPNTTDRNKSGYTLVSLSKKEKNSKLIFHEAAYILLDMLKLQQPNNHDPAYIILKNISGKNFDEHDHKAWDDWVKTNSSFSKNPSASHP